jgi:hypothetical protein
MVGVIYAGIQLSLLRKANKDTHDWNRRKTTHELLNDFTFGDFPRILTELRQMSSLPINEMTKYDDVIKEIPDEKKELFDKKLNQLLNYFESIAISIKNSIIDKEICYDYAALIYITYYEWSHPFIIKRRNKKNRPSIYINFEELALEWINVVEEEIKRSKSELINKGKQKL